MCKFRSNPYEDLSFTADNTIKASDWANNPSLLGRDADWLVSASCYLLKPPGHLGWKALCTSGELKAVMGFKGYGFYLYEDEWFYDKFIEYMENGYTGNPDRWDNHVMAQDRVAICWMEAAWEYYYRAKTWWYGRSIDEKRIINNAAVDAGGFSFIEKPDVGEIRIKYW